MMFLQAKEIEGFLKEKKRGEKFEDLREYMSLDNSWVFKK